MSDDQSQPSCTLPRVPQTFDTPHTQAPFELTRLELVLDLTGCNIFTVPVPLNEFEKPTGHRFEQWPLSVQAIINRCVDDWIARNPNAIVKAITQGVGDGMCMLAIHWKPKA